MTGTRRIGCVTVLVALAATWLPVVTEPAPAAARAGRVELTDRRTETSRVFRNPDGTHTLVQHAEPLSAAGTQAGCVAPAGTQSETEAAPLAVGRPWSASAGDQWTHVNKGASTTSYWNYDRANAKVGAAWGAPAHVYRSFFQMNTGALAGATILDARFTILLDHTPSGTATQVDLWESLPISRSQLLCWDNSGGHWQQGAPLASASGAAWEGGGQPDLSMGFASDKLKALVQRIATARGQTITFGLRAPNEANEWQWKKFRGETAAIEVTYNTLPRAPQKVNLVRPQPCGTAAAPTLVGSTQLTFAASGYDPDGDNLTTRLELHRASDGALEYQQDAGPTGSGAAFSWSPVPAGELTHGGTYYYLASSSDGIGSGPASPRCYLQVDDVGPAEPSITSADYPNGTAKIPARTVGTVVLRPAAADTDVSEYRYGFSPDKITQRIKAGADGTAVLPLTVWPTPFPSRQLYVRSADRAGNVSVRYTSWLLMATAAGTLRKTRGDVNGDGLADVTAVIDQGNGRTGVWNVLATGGGLATGTMSWDSGDNGGYPLSRSRPVRGDFDGDGRTDLAMFRDEAGRRVALYLLKSDGNRYEMPSPPVWSSDTAGWSISTARVLSGDTDGDGRTDIVVQLNTGNANWRVLVFPGAGLAAPVQWLQTAAGSGEWSRSAPVVADTDGDGKDDLVDVRDLGGCRTEAIVWRSTGSSFGTAGTTGYDSGGYCWNRSNQVAGDVDGDGRDDLVAIYDNAGATVLKVFRSTGGQFTVADWWSGALDPVTSTLSTGDTDRDGKDDALVVAALPGGGREVFRLGSSGTAFGAPVSGWREPRVGAGSGPKFDLEPRTYELVARHSGKCLDVDGPADATRFQQWGCWNGLNQRFRIVPVAGTDQYEIRTVHVKVEPADGKARCLDVGNQSTADNTPVVQWKCVGTANQQVLIDYVEGASYDTIVRLRFAHSDKCAAIEGAGTADGAKVVQLPCAAVPSQQWVLRAALNSPQLDGRYKVTSVLNPAGYVLDITDCQPDRGLRVWDWIATSPCQRWQVKPLGDAVYQIIDPSTAKALQVQGCATSGVAPVIVLDVDQSECQRWRIEPAPDGTWSIHQADTGRSLDVKGCDPAKGTGVIVWPYWNGPCQRWRLDPG